MKRTFIPLIIGALFLIASASLSLGVSVVEDEIVTSPIAGTGTISGSITNSSGTPQENAHVVAFAFGIIGGPAIAIGSTATNGAYEVTVPEGRYHVLAFKFGEGVAFASPVKVDSGANTDLDLSLSGGIFPGTIPDSEVLEQKV